jgi:hypothetical protein
MCCDGRVTAEQLAEALDLDVYEIGICQACLSFVSFPLDAGDEREVVRAVREFAPILWEEGLALPLQAALERARRRDVAGAADAIADVARNGPMAPIVSAVIRTLASDPHAGRARRSSVKVSCARPRRSSNCPRQIDRRPSV